MKFMLNFPKYLYRGDQDPDKKRNLKLTLVRNILMTNLSNGGSGKEIFKKPLIELLNNHISIGWEKTHFLSFSEEIDVAYYYGAYKIDNYKEVDLNEKWDFTILTLNTSSLILSSIQPKEKGIYSVEFIPMFNEFQPRYKLILIDVLTCLKTSTTPNVDLSDAIAKAERDKEWLILPTFPWNGEYSSKFDTKCLSNIQVFEAY